MNRILTYVGPRGWAVLVLASGAAIASPFLRAPKVQRTGAIASVDATAFPAERSSLSSSALRFPVEIAQPSSSGREEPGDVSARSASRAMGSSGTEASQPDLPSWAAQPSPLDELIANGASDLLESQGSTLEDRTVRPLRTWHSTVDDERGNSLRPGLPGTSQPSSTMGKSFGMAAREFPDPERSGMRQPHAAVIRASQPGNLLGSQASENRVGNDRSSHPKPLPKQREPQFVYQPSLREQQMKR